MGRRLFSVIFGGALLALLCWALVVSLVRRENAPLACGSPWNGKHGLGTNLCVPLKAVCILERGDENRIQKITAKQALPMLVQQSNRPTDRKWMPKYLELLDRLAGGVEFYRLACNMDPRAALVSYMAMSGNGKEEEQ